MSAPNLPSELDAATEPADVIVRRLVRALDYAEGFWLGFVRCNLLDQRRQAAAACRDLLAPLGIRLVEIELTELVTELLPILKARIADEQSAMNGTSEPTIFASEAAGAHRQSKLALFVYGLEHSIPSSEAYPPILSHLNLNRELFRQEILYPLVIWLPDYALTALARRAPDFWAWRSGLYEFVPDADLAAHTLAPIRGEAAHISSSLSEQAKRKRLVMLKGLLADYRELGDGPHERRAQSLILLNLGMIYRDLDEWREAKQAFQESLTIAREQADRIMVARLIHNLGVVAQEREDYEEARQLYEQSLELKREVGDWSTVASTLHNLGVLAQNKGDNEEAQRLYEQSLEIERKLDDWPGLASTLHQSGLMAQKRGDYEEARRLYEQSLEIERELGNTSGVASTLHALGMLARETGDNEGARQLYEQSLEIVRKLGNRWGVASTLGRIALLDDNERKYKEGLQRVKQAEEIFLQLDIPSEINWIKSIRERLEKKAADEE
jgi:Tfp pilus assembly protein PilF